jgi:hypothetical protein
MTIKRMPIGKFAVCGLLAACALFFVVAFFWKRAFAQDLPVSAPSQIREAWTQARKAWKLDAQFVCLDLERDSAQQAFSHTSIPLNSYVTPKPIKPPPTPKPWKSCAPASPDQHASS